MRETEKRMRRKKGRRYEYVSYEMTVTRGK